MSSQNACSLSVKEFNSISQWIKILTEIIYYLNDAEQLFGMEFLNLYF